MQPNSDQTGARSVYTLKVNQRAQEEKERKEKERLEREFEEKVQALSGQTRGPRRPRGLVFHEPGVFQKIADRKRREAKLKELREKIAALSDKSGIKDAVKLAKLTIVEDRKQPGNVQQSTIEEIPDVEWWDKEVIKDTPLETVILKLDSGNYDPKELFPGVTSQIQHPKEKKPPGPDDQDVEIPIYPTKDELKKIRKQRRRDEEARKQYEIRIGVRPKPEPKLKKSNIIYTLGEELVTNPSMAEQKVREQVEQRQLAHKEHNESKKLTEQERKEKKLNKVREDTDVVGLWVTLYRILNLTSQANKFKVIQNARQLTMTGLLALNKTMNVVIVEGGPKQQRKYRHLMLDRIDWTNQSKSQEQEQVETLNNCALVWEGQVDKRSFNGFRVKQFKEEPEAKEYFRSINLCHYWDLASNVTILESVKDNHFNI